MKRVKQLLSIMIAIVMVVASVCVVNEPVKTEAAVKIIVGKKLNVSVNGTDTIVVKGKASAKSANAKIAKVKKVKKGSGMTKITIQGKKVGKVKVKIKVGKKSKKVKVTVRPKIVAGVRAALLTSNSAKISWKKAKGASGYRVYRSTSAAGPFKKIATVKGYKKTSYTNYSLALGNYYYYKVIAYGKKGLTSEEYSNVVSVKTWKLYWSDEFNGNKINEKVWNYITGAGGWGNNELQNYQPEYNKVANGKLTIMPTFEYDTDAEEWLQDSVYSGRLDTKGKFTFQYGYLQFRAKQAKGVGTWTAGWALGSKNAWPLCGEIDVFETTSAKTKTIIPQSLHCKRFNGMSGSSANKHFDSTIPTATSAYHTYGVIWTPTSITFTIDGNPTGTYDPDTYVTEGRGIDDTAVWPYKQPFYLLVNCAVGGVLGGQLEPTYWKKVGSRVDEEGTVIDKYQDYLIYDWIRIYK